MALPPSEIISNEDGTFTQIEYRFDDNNNILKVTRVIKKELHKSLASKSVKMRKEWKKFGDSANDTDGPQNGITSLADEIFLKLKIPSFLKEDNKSMAAIVKTAAKRITCGNCGGDHITVRCPLKNKIIKEEKKEEVKNVYVAPSRRSDRKDDNCTLRVSNLPEETTERDVRELFKMAGYIARCYLPVDQNRVCRGFCYLTFGSKEEAEKGIQIVNGHRYAHRVLNVEFAEPRK